MSKVYRLHTGQDGTGWFLSTPVTSKQLETIVTLGVDVATSIPSPFARIDLVKSAFQWVADNGIDGETAHHKLVSEALDVAQLFYTSKKYKDEIEIIAYCPNERFEKLRENKAKTRHSHLAETLNVYWEQDSVSVEQSGDLVLYNFESIKKLYVILNKNTKLPIGGTSPITLFFSFPDAQKVAASLKITCGSDTLFDDKYASLAQREVSFVEYFFALSKQDDFEFHFPEVFNYLKAVKKNLTRDLLKKVSSMDEKTLKIYKKCPVLDNEKDTCEVLGIPLGVQLFDSDHLVSTSDFLITSELSVTGLKPLVLPHDKFTEPWIYTTSGVYWDEKTEVPNSNIAKPGESILPLQGDKYYWLSIGNFLEDKIIMLNYSINSGIFETCGAKRHLLPLTATFFKYFKVENISKYLKLEELAGGGIEAKLEIPVKGGTIIYKKIYHTEDIVPLYLHLAILPFIQAEKVNIDYTIGVIDARQEDHSTEITVSCYNKGTHFDIGTPITRSPGSDTPKSIYYKTTKTFELVKIETGSTRGFIVPIFKKYKGGNSVDFAIDFGTTNTHIEYKHDNNIPVALDSISEFWMWNSLFDRNNPKIDPLELANERVFENDMIPYTFSEQNQEFHFPFRTALAINDGEDFSKKLILFQQANSYLPYEKIHLQPHLKEYTQLKWSNYSDPHDEMKVESYIECLVTLVFYKTLLIGGSLDKTTITWFYPVSMDEGELGVLFKLWKKVYKKIFGLEANDKIIRGIPESVAPYLYYKSSVEGLSLSIDIGGGSTDIAVFDEEEEKAKLISSFKFAGNALFGDGYPSKEYKNDSDRNGFVKSFRKDAYNAVEGDPNNSLILSDILDKTKDSADFSNFLFKLEQNTTKPFSYTRLIEKHKSLKLPILIFYGAIAYYSANLMKKSGIGIPKYILLSGTASKTSSILDPSHNLNNLSKMFKFIFEMIYKEEVESDISLKLSPISKEITCKGALKGSISSSIYNNNIMFWIGGLTDLWGTAIDKEKEVSDTPKYKDIDDTIKIELEKSILDYYSILDKYVNSIPLEAKYMIESESYEIFKKMRANSIKDFLVRGMKAYYKKNDKHIEETLFFYPFIGILNKLAFELSSNK